MSQQDDAIPRLVIGIGLQADEIQKVVHPLELPELLPDFHEVRCLCPSAP